MYDYRVGVHRTVHGYNWDNGILISETHVILEDFIRSCRDDQCEFQEAFDGSIIPQKIRPQIVEGLKAYRFPGWRRDSLHVILDGCAYDARARLTRGHDIVGNYFDRSAERRLYIWRREGF